MALRAGTVLLALVGLFWLASGAGARTANVAGLQVGLHARALYSGTIDGVMGSGTRRAVRRLQRRAGIAVDGVPGPQTRRALGRYAHHRLGSRMLQAGRRGWDVASLQFKLAWHGFPSGYLDGDFGGHTDAALRKYQRWAGITADGVAGPATIRALRRGRAHVPFHLLWPVAAPVGDRFGPRGNRFHPGIDLPAPYGARVRAARAGRVVRAGWNAGGYGFLIVIRHGRHVRTFYAHLSHIGVHHGERVSAGERIGRVGASGEATGPHLHFEVRRRGAAVDPLPALR
ncbi:MAG TPA: peptidoglycan DD-metalloendopeptidase family protein [Gaiellaceae bacterium]|jgi:murein DD-endopeptidase MepM/ murein hydrolase activator NlpD